MTARPAPLGAVLLTAVLAAVLAVGAGAGCRKEESTPGGGEIAQPSPPVVSDGGGVGAVTPPDGPDVEAERDGVAKPVDPATSKDAVKPGKPETKVEPRRRSTEPSAPAVNEEIPPSLFEPPPPPPAPPQQHVDKQRPPMPPLPPIEDPRPSPP
ncbi:MAG: hypothetical protein H0X17_22175, partial [Deltaproteobacteria bacterium]|nr:hypothetical protein [Deltaproteobacteria bacterium]